MEKQRKIWIHFNTENFKAYNSTSEGTKHIFSQETITQFVDIYCMHEKMVKFINSAVGQFHDNTSTKVKLYATGIFQRLNFDERYQLVNAVFVSTGYRLNIISEDLENFYYKGVHGVKNSSSLIQSIEQVEFRSVVICGSFQQHLSQLDKIKTILEKKGVTVLSPWTTKIQPATIGTDFILLEGQKPLKNKRDTWTHKFEHMEKFKQADAIILCNPGGIIGQGTSFELGYMMALEKRVIFTEPPREYSIYFPYEVESDF